MQSAYKSEEKKRKALEVYDQALSAWPLPYKVQRVNTSFGETQLIISGPEAAPPLVLLHGGGGNSTMWHVNVAEFSKHFRVYAIDIIGEAGKSAGTRPSYQSKGHAYWLKEVFQALGLKKLALCGASLGGMLAHQFALEFPESISCLILLAPPTLLKMRTAFIFNALAANLFPTPYFARRFLNYMSRRGKYLSEAFIQSFIVQFQAYKPNFDKIPVISDEEIKQLPLRTLVLLGENEVLYNPYQAFERIQNLAPTISVAIIPKAGHALSFDQIDLVNHKIISFIADL